MSPDALGPLRFLEAPRTQRPPRVTQGPPPKQLPSAHKEGREELWPNDMFLTELQENNVNKPRRVGFDRSNAEKEAGDMRFCHGFSHSKCLHAGPKGPGAPRCPGASAEQPASRPGPRAPKAHTGTLEASDKLNKHVFVFLRIARNSHENQ